MAALQYYPADNSHVKYVGITIFQNNVLWLALSGSGQDTYRRSLEFIGDSITCGYGVDDSYCQNKKDRQEEFAASYQKFLSDIRRLNPDAVILCTYGIMNQRLFPYIEQVIAAYKNMTNDEKVYSMKFDLHQESDGYVVDFHPSPRTHQKSAWVLVQKIKEIMNW